MTEHDVLSRRTFAKLASGLVIAPSIAPRFLESLRGAGGQGGWPRYGQAMVVDFLASPGPFNTPINVEALTPEMVANVLSSGITALNLTIGGNTPEQVFQSMAGSGISTDIRAPS